MTGTRKIETGREFRGGGGTVNRRPRGAAIAIRRGLRHSRARMGSVRESSLAGEVWALPAAPVVGVRAVAGMAILSLMFLAVALWNGFPLIFYDTGAYVLEGLGGVFLVERAPVYSEFLFLAAGHFSLWPIVILQAVITAWMILELARMEVPGLTLWGLAGIGAGLSLLTGIGWYVGQVEPDCMTPLVILGSYLLLFRSTRLGAVRSRWVVGITALAVACHPSHLGLIGGADDLCGGAETAGALRCRACRSRELRQGLASRWASALALILAGNFALARSLFIVALRLGVCFRPADAGRHCQAAAGRYLSASPGYYLCAYRDHLAAQCQCLAVGRRSAFHAAGRLCRIRQAEDKRMIADSLRRYPLMQLKAALYDSRAAVFRCSGPATASNRRHGF